MSWTSEWFGHSLVGITTFLIALKIGLISNSYDESLISFGVIFHIALLTGAFTYKAVGGRDPVLWSRQMTRPPVPAFPLWDRELDG